MLEHYPDDGWGISEEWGRFRQLEIVSGKGQAISTQSDPDQLLGGMDGDRQISSRKNADPQKLLGDKSGDGEISPSKMTDPQKLLGDKLGDRENISPSNQRRHKGDGSGSIHWRTVTRNGKDYQQAYYHYEFWESGDRLVKSSRYIPKGKLAQVQRLNNEKAPVRDILKLLGVIR